MNITRENADALNAVLKVNIEEADYSQKVDDVLKDYRKKANVPGFRPGKVPMGMIKKMYYVPVLVEEVNKLVSESTSKYLIDEKLNILGEPMPSETEQSTIDWENDKTFEFAFDLGLAPEVDLTITGRNKFTKYKIKIDDEIRSKYIENYARKFGAFKTVEEIGDKEFIKCDFVELDEAGNPKEDGLKVEEGSISLEFMKEEAEEAKKEFKGKKVGDKVVLDVKKYFTNEADLAGMLKIQKEELGNIGNMFELEIKTISIYEASEINQELFDKVYGEGVVKSEEEFKAKIDEEIEANLEQESDWKFTQDTKEALISKNKLELPDAFLKRWLLAVNKDKFTAEQIEAEYPKFAEDLNWQLLRDKLGKDNEIQVSEEEAKEVAKKFAQYQFMQYGMGGGNIPDEYLDNYASELMKKEEDRRRFFEQKLEEKVFDKIKEIAKVEEKEITSEKFNKMLEK